MQRYYFFSRCTNFRVYFTSAEDIKNKAEDLVEYVVEKGTPVLEKSACLVKEKAIEVTKEVLKKLEQEEK